MHLISYSNYAYNEIEQYRIVKGRIDTPKCLFYIVTQVEKLIYSNRTVKTVGLVKNGIY